MEEKNSQLENNIELIKSFREESPEYEYQFIDYILFFLLWKYLSERLVRGINNYQNLCGVENFEYSNLDDKKIPISNISYIPKLLRAKFPELKDICFLLPSELFSKLVEKVYWDKDIYVLKKVKEVFLKLGEWDKKLYSLRIILDRNDCLIQNNICKDCIRLVEKLVLSYRPNTYGELSRALVSEALTKIVDRERVELITWIDSFLNEKNSKEERKF